MKRPVIFKTRNIQVLIAVAALGIAAHGCGKKTDTDPELPVSGFKIPLTDSSEAQKLAAQGQVTCKDPEKCSDSVAMVVSAEERSINLCSGFMVSDDVLVTNSHCIPAALRGQDSPCRDKIHFYFPRTSKFEARHADCGKIVFASLVDLPDQYMGPDYAFVRLDQPSGRPKLEISTEGLAEAAPVSVVRMTPKSAVSPVGEIDTTQCRVVQRSYALPQFSQPLNPVVTVGDCKLVNGNLGAPVLDNRGQVRAIAHGSLDFSKDVRYSLESRVEASISDLAYATNFACAYNPLDADSDITGVRLPKACTTDLSNDTLRKLRQDIVNGRNPDIHVLAQETAFLNWAKRNSAQFRWALTGDTPVPSCLNSPQSWIGIFKRPKGFMQIQLPHFETTSHLNTYLQRNYFLKVTSQVPVQITLDVTNIRKAANGHIKVETPEKVLFDDVLSACE
jgi:hypothetical protein